MTRWGDDFERASRRYAGATWVVHILTALMLVVLVLDIFGVISL